ncbi:MAG: hypothetical protein ACHQ50_07015 [Fimbriimonadales bacterium]
MRLRRFENRTLTTQAFRDALKHTIRHWPARASTITFFVDRESDLHGLRFIVDFGPAATGRYRAPNDFDFTCAVRAGTNDRGGYTIGGVSKSYDWGFDDFYLELHDALATGPKAPFEFYVSFSDRKIARRS